jgi:cob(I)alamin adenosyltransferase
MKIYTKTGDKGETGLFGGQRVRKGDLRIAAYGDIDELNALLGMARSLNQDGEVEKFLQKIQNELFDLGALLATPARDRGKLKGNNFIRKEETAFLEQSIDRCEKELSPLTTFILPGGSDVAATLHLARTVCRRAERAIVTMNDREPGAVEEEILCYVNRLSDFLFVLARWVNFKNGVSDVPWEKK